MGAQFRLPEASVGGQGLTPDAEAAGWGGLSAWTIPWPYLHEFLSIVTHPKIYPTLVTLGEGYGYWQLFRASLAKGQIVGPRVHDGGIASICLNHDVLDFPQLRVRNPLPR